MNPDLSQMRIGYAPSDESLVRPADRRRFVAYAKNRNLKYEFARQDEDYDLLVLAPGTDITRWLRNKGKGKLIVDTVDSYLAIPPSDVKALFRGVAKFAFRDTRYLVWNFNNALKEICRRADAVVCSTVEQKNDILPLCENVHIILDVHDHCKPGSMKSDYSAGDVFNFVWEGLPLNVQFFSLIRSELLSIQAKRKFALHLVTDVQYGRFLSGKVMRGSTIDLIAGMFDRVYLYSWNELLAARIISACDLALVPIPLDDPVNAGKPENKLLIFWRLGVPAIVSATPAYSRVMEQSGINMAARDLQEWRLLLERYMVDEGSRRDAGQRGKRFAEQHYSFEKIFDQWDSVIRSVLH
jgi:glycosyltransferase involved in cell wall biosynthesis